MQAAEKITLTAEEYLAAERRAETKCEFLGGEIFAMSGGAHAHSAIATNLTIALGVALRGKGCRPLNSDMRLKVEATGLYAYPDLQVVCGQPLFEDESSDTLLNPTVIVEVLSPSTAAWDRGKKFWHYRHLDSLTHYVLVASDQPLVEVYTRQPNGGWLLAAHDTTAATVTLSALDVSVALADIYSGIELVSTGRH